MHLSSFLRDDLILLGAKVDSKEAAIRLLTERIALTHHGADAEIILNKIMEREALTTTAFPNGVAIPHARIENFEDLVIAALVPEKPVDGSRIIFLILTDINKSNLYLNVLASLSKICRAAEYIERLIFAESPRDFIQILESFHLAVKEAVYVSDLMSAPPKYLFSDSTIKDALDFMKYYSLQYIPVCDRNTHFLGEVTAHVILSIGLSHYDQMKANYQSLSSLKPFEDLLKNETIIQLKSIMRVPPAVLSPHTLLNEAAFQFVKHNRYHLPVAQDGVCVGVLNQIDLINRFLRV